jgi:hypothetical protein
MTTFSSGTYSNVTLGNAIPRLISDAQANFSIPLFESVILARFNAANLTCASENALVTFDGNAQRIGDAADIALLQESITSAGAATTTSAPNAGQKIKRHQSASSADAATPTATAPSTTSSAIYPTSTSTDSNSDFTITQQVLDFARVVVLFVLQQEDIDSAVEAQSELQHVFSLDELTNSAAKNLSIGGGNTVDLVEYRLNLGNGTEGGLNGTLSRRGLMGRGTGLLGVL